MTSAELIDRMTELVKQQAEIIKELDYALEIAGVDSGLEADIESAEMERRALQCM